MNTLNTLESWCKDLEIAFDKGKKQIFWATPFDEIKRGIILAEFGKDYSFQNESLEKICERQKEMFPERPLWERLEETKNDSSWESAPIVELGETLLQEALQLNATDIHLEPEEKQLKIRLRIDGILIFHRTLPSWLKEPLLQRYKILSKMDIAERRLPQDGSFSFFKREEEIFVRVNTLPTKFGEKCVLRLLPPNQTRDLNALGFPEDTQKKLLDFIKVPQGIFIVCGPTGSGKSSTLHALLHEIIKKPLNVSTVENPVESILPGANQIQTNEKAGLTFAVALRALLRQDPDVILIGEIRDKETASIALQAARTGHLILATLHANSAKSVTSRLNDLGISTNDLSDCLLGAISQRLVRKKCHCKTSDCPNCHNSGFAGRIPIFEWIDFRNKKESEPISYYAQTKVKNNETTKEEIERVLGISEN